MDTLSYRKKGVESNELKTAEVLTPDGLQGVELIPAKIIFRWMIKDNQTGETYSSISGLARMCDKDVSNMTRYSMVVEMSTISAEILTATGEKTVVLFSESQMLEVIAKYNPTL
jgi:hypothetical protein